MTLTTIGSTKGSNIKPLLGHASVREHAAPHSGAVPAKPSDAPRGRRLTPRELEMLRFASMGLSGPMIAKELTISESTVKAHFEHIRTKLGVPDRTAAVAYALRAGLIT